MNYFAHALPFLDRPTFVIGTSLPDTFASMSAAVAVGAVSVGVVVVWPRNLSVKAFVSATPGLRLVGVLRTFSRPPTASPGAAKTQATRDFGGGGTARTEERRGCLGC